MSGNVRILLTLVDRVDLIVSFRSFSGCGLAHHPSFLGAVAVCLRKHRLRVAGLERECQAQGFGGGGLKYLGDSDLFAPCRHGQTQKHTAA